MNQSIFSNLRVIGMILLAAGCVARASAEARSHALPLAPLDDTCVTEPGYGEFRQLLTRVVGTRDVAGFRALFTTDGGMRVQGISLHAGWEKPAVSQVWDELDSILQLGCSTDTKGKLYLPAMAVLIDHPDVEPGYVAALKDLVVGSRPGNAQGGLRSVKRGQLMEVVKYDRKGWIEVVVNDRPAYVQSTDVRSPHDFQLTLRREAGSWRISEFTGGV